MKWALPLCFALLAGCFTPTEEARELVIAKLQSERLEILAGLHRQKADCEAFEIEFPANAAGIEDCRINLLAMTEASQQSLSALSRRIEEVKAGR